MFVSLVTHGLQALVISWCAHHLMKGHKVAAAMVGAILGGIAGNQIDKAVNNTTGQRITVRLDQKRNGTRSYTVVQVASKNNPIYVGQRVRVIIGNNGSRVLAY